MEYNVNPNKKKPLLIVNNEQGLFDGLYVVVSFKLSGVGDFGNL